MSKEAAIQLLQQAENDVELQKELEEALAASEAEEAFLAVAAKRGLEFTGAEFQEAVAEAEATPPEDGELSDSDLEQVAGGVVLDNGAGITTFRLSPRIFELGTRFSTGLLGRKTGRLSYEGPPRP